MIAGADQEPRLRLKLLEVLLYDHCLGAAVHERGEIEMVAGHDHDVEIAGDVQHPVEQGQGIVQVGDEKQAHGQFA